MSMLTLVCWPEVRSEFIELFDSIEEESSLPVGAQLYQRLTEIGGKGRMRGFTRDNRMAVVVWSPETMLLAVEDKGEDVMTYCADHKPLLSEIELPDDGADAFRAFFGGVFNGVPYPKIEERPLRA
jgi:hypothetical protein